MNHYQPSSLSSTNPFDAGCDLAVSVVIAEHFDHLPWLEGLGFW
ncbi:hypothetical protein [Paeniglutamicibacter sp.]